MQSLTSRVIASFEHAPDPRFRALMTSLVKYLHAFAEEVCLSDAEWQQAIEFLTATGQKSVDGRQEFILLSEVLGLSALLVRLNHVATAAATEATVLGPFYTMDAPALGYGADIANGAPGAPCVVSGTVKNVDRTPIARARIEVCQADSRGLYDVQLEPSLRPRNRGLFETDDGGQFKFRTVVAEAYPIPTDGAERRRRSRAQLLLERSAIAARASCRL